MTSPSHDEKLKATLAKLKEDQNRVATQFRDEETKRQEAAVRAHPKVPEWGATPKEAGQVCEKQGGRVEIVAEGYLSCFVGDAEEPIFIARYARLSGERIDRIDTYLEGADATRERDKLIESFGRYDSERVSHGFRLWEWRSRGIFLTSYDRGVLFANFIPGDP